jgi:amidase
MSFAKIEEALAKVVEVDQAGYRLNAVLAITDGLVFNETSGPLSGIPILIKDNIEAIGLPATAGSLALSDTPVVRDSSVAKRLRAAGATIYFLIESARVSVNCWLPAKVGIENS